MVTAQNSFLQNNALRLEIDGLKEITKLELDARQFGNASGYLFVHRSGNLKQCINALAIKIKCTLERLLFISLFCSCKETSHVVILKLKVLDHWEYLSKIS